jgi:hypothetical protein
MVLQRRHPKIELSDNGDSAPILEVGDLIFAEWDDEDLDDSVDKIIHLFLGYEPTVYKKYRVLVIKARHGSENKEGSILNTGYLWYNMRYEIYHYD